MAVAWSIASSRTLRPEKGYLYIVGAGGEEPHILTRTRVDGLVSYPAWSPTSEQVAYTSQREPGGIWLADVNDERDPIFLGEGQQCAWAPDGERIAITYILSTTFTIYILNVRTGERIEVFHVSEEGRYPRGGNIAWSPVDDRLAFSFKQYDYYNPDELCGIYEMDLVSGEIRLLTESRQGASPSWSPDGTMLAFNGVANDKYTLVIMQLRDGVMIAPLDMLLWGGAVRWSPDGNEIAFQEASGIIYALDVAVALGTSQDPP